MYHLFLKYYRSSKISTKKNQYNSQKDQSNDINKIQLCHPRQSTSHTLNLAYPLDGVVCDNGFDVSVQASNLAMFFQHGSILLRWSCLPVLRDLFHQILK